MQMIADAQAREANERTIAAVNQRKEELGRELLATPEETGSWVDVDGMMAAAERSGFNPVTFINAGGLSAYTQSWRTNPEAAFKLMTPEYSLTSASQVPQQHSMLSAFGGALSAGAQTFGTQYRANQSYDLQMARLEQADEQFMMGLSSSNGYRTALALSGGTAGSGSSNARSGAGAAGGMSDLPYPTKWKYQDDVTVTNPWSRLPIDGKTPDAEVGEKRYAEPGELLFGVRNMINDSVRIISGRDLEDWGVAAGMNIGSYIKPGDKGLGVAIGRWWNSPTSLPSRFMAPSAASQRSVTPYAPFAGAYPSWATP